MSRRQGVHCIRVWHRIVPLRTRNTFTIMWSSTSTTVRMFHVKLPGHIYAELPLCVEGLFVLLQFDFSEKVCISSTQIWYWLGTFITLFITIFQYTRSQLRTKPKIIKMLNKTLLKFDQKVVKFIPIIVEFDQSCSQHLTTFGLG